MGRKLSPAHIEKMSATLRGRKLSPERVDKVRQANLKRGPQHPSGVVCDFRSPTNVVWHVSNINYFVRAHKYLFDESDATWITSGRSPYCRAADGLRSLCARTSPRGSWKGWTLVSDVERFKNAGDDLLGRVGLQE
jgi:hypothetical protein